MAAGHEIEIKFRVKDVKPLGAALLSAGFRLATERTHEMNTLYDLPSGTLRARGALLRLRRYGDLWTLTFKDRSTTQGRHKSRREIETRVENGPAMAELLEALGYRPSFAYEKFRSEWTDRTGHVVVDETPIGNFGEIEGPPEWIDAIAGTLGITAGQYITASYAELFMEWKQQSRSPASNMLFASLA
ncbi:MAG TPA: class IV adenylate cyclase [Candidatus Limnocylindrales bacterium]|nr:class IV adenylate cyclase [Candidatus Limnocylindrales bacterium]